MKIVQFEDQELSFPTLWSEYSFHQWQQIMLIKQQQDAGHYPNDLKYILDLMNIISTNDVSEMTMVQVADILNECLECLAVQPNTIDVDTFNFEGVDYVYKKNLDAITLAENIAIENLQQSTENTFDILHVVLAILIRPGYHNDKGIWKQEKLNEDDLIQRSEIIKRMPVTNVLGMLNFFLNGK